MRDYLAYLEDIAEFMKDIEEFIKGFDFESFCRDDKTESAVARKLELIGEASKQIPQEIKDINNDIPWKNMAGMRDILIHQYFGIDHKIVWETITVLLPDIRSKIIKVISKIEKK